MEKNSIAGLNRSFVQINPLAGYCALSDQRDNTHVRRKFYDIHVAHASPTAAEALNRIGQLYSVEADIRGQPPDERRNARQARAGPQLQSLHAWLHATLLSVSKKSELALAIRYALSRWAALTRYCDDGRIEIDNNAAERSLRPHRTWTEKLVICWL